MAAKFPFKKGQRVQSDYYEGKWRRYFVESISRDSTCSSGFRMTGRSIRCRACGHRQPDLCGVDSAWFKPWWGARGRKATLLSSDVGP